MPLFDFGGPFRSKKVVIAKIGVSSALGKLIVYRLVFKTTCFMSKKSSYDTKNSKRTFF